MNVRLDKALDWACYRMPVSICMLCGFPSVGMMDKDRCQHCNSPRSGVWDAKPWAPKGTLVVVDEEPVTNFTE